MYCKLYIDDKGLGLDPDQLCFGCWKDVLNEKIINLEFWMFDYDFFDRKEYFNWKENTSCTEDARTLKNYEGKNYLQF